MTITLSKTETRLLLEAAERGGNLLIPDATKPATRQRLLGRFERDGLVHVHEDGHVLTPTGYRAAGLRPPRQNKQGSPDAVSGKEAANAKPQRGAKQALVLDLLGRGEGASVPELMSATGWLPHTVRAALSRLRSGGTELLKSAREDGQTAYRIAVEEPAPKRTRSRGGRQSAQAEAAAA